MMWGKGCSARPTLADLRRGEFAAGVEVESRRGKREQGELKSKGTGTTPK